MNIVVSVTDGCHGQPAHGVGVEIACSGGDVRDFGANGYTNEHGQFRFADSGTDTGGATYSVTIDVDRYFSVNGNISFYRKIILMCRVVNADDEYWIRFLITPFSGATNCLHSRAGAPQLPREGA